MYLIALQETKFDNPVTEFTEDQLEKFQLRYYNADIHRTAFVLPQFAKKVRTQASCFSPFLFPVFLLGQQAPVCEFSKWIFLSQFLGAFYMTPTRR